MTQQIEKKLDQLVAENEDYEDIVDELVEDFPGFLGDVWEVILAALG